MGSRRGELVALVDELDACPALLAVLAGGGSHDDTACGWCAPRMRVLGSVRAIEQTNDYARVWAERFGSGGGARSG